MEELAFIDNSSFYDGMSYIEPIVRYHLDQSRENEQVLYHFYISTLLNYWIKAKRVLLDPTPQEVSIALHRRKELHTELSRPLQYGSRFYEIDVYPDYFALSNDEYLLRLKDRVIDLHRIFERYFQSVQREFNKITILKAFYFLSLILCLDPLLLLDDDDALIEMRDRNRSDRNYAHPVGSTHPCPSVSA